MKKISVILMCMCSLFLFTGCYTNEFGENQFVDNGEPDVSKEIDIKTLKNMHDGVDKFFLESATIDEMAKHLDEIKAMKGVAEAWTTDDALYVKTNDGITCFWLYPNDLQADEESLYNAAKQMTRSIVSGDAKDHDILRPQKIAIINQQSSDEGVVRVERNKFLNDLKDEFDKVGFAVVDYIDQKGADLDFFSSKIKEYDIIFLLTHGAYFKNDYHALLTGADVSFISVDTCEAKIDEAKKLIKKLLTNWRDGVSLGTVKEVVNGDSIPKTYFSINEDFITQTVKGSLNDAIIFNAACHSLQGSESLAYAFGAKTYIGYDQGACMGPGAGYKFFENMLLGMNVDTAFRTLEKKNYVYVHDADHERQKHPNAELKIVGSKNVCIIHPLVVATEPGEITSTTVELNAMMTKWYNTLNNKILKVGFCWSSTDKEPKDSVNSNNSYSKYVVYNIDKDGTCNFNGKMEGLSPNTTFYYRPFLYMNNEYYYGDVKEIKTKEEEKKEDDDIRAYLEKLYHDTDGKHWTRNDNWLSKDIPIERWYGVTLWGGLWIDLDNNNLNGSIDLSGCSSLKRFSCKNNNLESIDVSGTAIETLNYCNNNLQSLNVSECTALRELYCYDNNLASLDASGCTALKRLDCYDNNLTSLNVSGCTALWQLKCSRNSLTSLNVSGNTALYELMCSDNNLDSLNVLGCTELVVLYCKNNHIRSEVPLDFDKLRIFEHDQLYNYYYDYELSKTTYKENKYGWFYPGEPESLYHGRLSSPNAPRRQTKKK